MPDPLPRFKPDPAPAVHALPEYLAEGDLLADYADTKAVLQVPWMGVVAMAFAGYRNFYRTFWGAFRETFASREMVEACESLRRDAEDAVLALEPPPITPRLETVGYAPRELQDIRDMIEVFSHGNFAYCQMATLARLLLEGHDLANHSTAAPFSGRHAPEASVPFLLMEAHHVDAPTKAVYEDIMRRLGLPFVNTDYRALARWPSCIALCWGDLREHVTSPQYEQIVTGMHHAHVEAALSMPNPGRLSGDALRAAAEKDGSPDEILAVVQLFQWLLPGLIANVAFFRAQFEAG